MPTKQLRATPDPLLLRSRVRAEAQQTRHIVLVRSVIPLVPRQPGLGSLVPQLCDLAAALSGFASQQPLRGSSELLVATPVRRCALDTEQQRQQQRRQQRQQQPR